MNTQTSTQAPPSRQRDAGSQTEEGQGDQEVERELEPEELPPSVADEEDAATQDTILIGSGEKPVNHESATSRRLNR